MSTYQILRTFLMSVIFFVSVRNDGLVEKPLLTPSSEQSHAVPYGYLYFTMRYRSESAYNLMTKTEGSGWLSGNPT
jgi:hypothetical protein